ncbi:MAG TPA: nuclear transport factor 2 family protein [Rhizomicrobium sp.]|jgi:ketosteroid isomerase-like protein|nr:nuclear transport factor 2 family protein [Rhizomicrobium sp.]
MAAVAGIPESANAQAGKGLDPETEAIIWKHYKAWVDKDWHTEDMLLADNFTFSSAAGDDHISKSVFKTRCWDNNAKDIKRFDLLRIFGSGNEAFVKYDCLTMDDKTFRNVEYFRLRDGKLVALECYFGAPSNYPSAVSAGRK